MKKVFSYSLAAANFEGHGGTIEGDFSGVLVNRDTKSTVPITNGHFSCPNTN